MQESITQYKQPPPYSAQYQPPPLYIHSHSNVHIHNKPTLLKPILSKAACPQEPAMSYPQQQQEVPMVFSTNHPQPDAQSDDTSDFLLTLLINFSFATF